VLLYISRGLNVAQSYFTPNSYLFAGTVTTQTFLASVATLLHEQYSHVEARWFCTEHRVYIDLPDQQHQWLSRHTYH